MNFDVGGLGLAFFGQVLSIIFINIVLSGDNAVVIAMAARTLPPRQRKRAIFFGAFGAIVLRIFFTALAAVLLLIPLLQFLGGVTLVWVAWKLLRQGDDEGANVSEASTLWEAIRIIVIADAIMSLDNILAIGAASKGNLALLLFGLTVSMSIIMFFSNLVAILMNRFPVLVLAGGGILAWVAAEMITHDAFVGSLIASIVDAEMYERGLPPLITVGVLAVHLLWRKRSAVVPERAPREVEVH